MKNDNHEKALDCSDVFAKNALTIESFEEASDALLSLKKADKSRARDVALQILHERIGDAFYHALAFEVLYAVSLGDAVVYIEKNARQESVYVLGAMLTAVAEDVGALDGHDEILKAVSLLRQALALRPAEDLQELSTKRAWFEEAYP